MDCAPGSVILVTGVMAAGKSTVAQMLAESFPRAAHIRGDVFRRFIVTGRSEPTPSMPAEARQQLLLRYRLAATAADAYAQAGFVAVVQDIILGPSLLEMIDMLTTRELFVVILDPEPHAVEERESTRRKTGYADRWTPTELVAGLRATTPRIGLWLDTTDLDEHQTVTAVLERLRDARVTSPRRARHARRHAPVPARQHHGRAAGDAGVRRDRRRQHRVRAPGCHERGGGPRRGGRRRGWPRHRAAGRLRAGRTTVIVSHNLAAVRDADTIIVLDGGRVVERGDHRSLLARDGAYALLYQAHAADGGSPAGSGAVGGSPVAVAAL
ncbi:MAG: AAA family ATPase [Streptosporangiales bacterium]